MAGSRTARDTWNLNHHHHHHLGSFSLWLLAAFPFLPDGRLGLEWGVVGNVPFNFFGRILRIKHVSIGNEVNDRTAPILSLG